MKNVLLSFLLIGLNLIALGQPTITSFSSASGAPGITVTINGTNFSTTPTNNIVYFGATKATVTAATTTQLTVTVPSGATFAPITVTTNNLTAYSSLLFMPTFSGSSTLDATTFAPRIEVNIPIISPHQISSIDVGDIDGDGKIDLAVNRNQSSQLSLFRNTSTPGTITTGSFAAGVNFSAGSLPTHIKVADIDSDGKLDIVSANYLSENVSLFRNTSSSGSLTTGSLATKVDYATTAIPETVFIGDLDGDGRTDFGATNQPTPSNFASIFRNTMTSPANFTAGSFAAKFDLPTGTNPYGSVIRDLDGDNKHDLVFANSGTNTISIYRNISSAGSLSVGSFSSKTDITVGSQPWMIQAGDVDGDGKTDLIIGYAGTLISVLRNTSSGGTISFAAKVDFTVGTNPYFIALGDLNGDNKLDIAVSNRASNTVSLLKNNSTPGTISFASKVDLATKTNPEDILIADIDGDHKPELIVKNFEGGFVANTGSVSVFQNISGSIAAPVITSFSPASGAPGITVTINGTNFSSTPGDNIVKFNGTTATVSTSTNTLLSVIVPNGATTGNITVTVNNLTATSSSIFTICNLPEQPSEIAGNSPICQGTSNVIYSVTNVVGITYNWNYSGTGVTLTPSGNSVSINFSGNATSGTLSVSATNSCGTSLSRVKEIVVNPLPPKPQITADFSNPSTPVLTSSSTSGNQWYLNNNPIASGVNQTFTPTAPGSYTVHVTLLGCSSSFSDSSPVIITGDIDSHSGINIYPNPSINTIIITGISESINSITYADLTGRISKLNVTRLGNSYQADISELSTGLYLLLIKEGDSTHKIKLIKK